VIALIPARGGSKGIHRKNVQLISGHPLISYSIAACMLCKQIEKVIVTSDCDEIIDVSRKYGANVPFKRPAEFATATSPDSEFLSHFFDNSNADEIVLIRPTTPLRQPVLMSKIINFYNDNRVNSSGLRTIHEIEETPYKLFYKQDKYCRGFFESFNDLIDYTNLPRQIFPITYRGNGYLDIVKRSTVENEMTFGDNILGYVTDSTIDVDSIEHLEMIRTMNSEEKFLLLSFLNSRR
jgi:CMP-N,N'-diacetyllegionaminic acid synthase